VLFQRLGEAAAKAHSLIPYSPQFASEHRETRHVCVRWKGEEQRGILQRTIDQAFGQGQCTLLASEDPSEIVVFYYVDGLPMSAINDLTGRCLEAFLKRRKAWQRQTILNGGNSNGSYKQRIGVPVYSGKDAEERVLASGVVYQLYNVRGQNVGVYTPNDIPELASAEQQQHHAEN
jgi:hypothetical protein